MTDYRTELQAFVDAAASFTEPALGHHKAWAEAVARARVALSVPESSANTVCPITPPPELVKQWLTEGRHQDYCSATEHAIAQAARWGADQELEACCDYLQHEDFHGFASELRAARRPKPTNLKEQALNSWDRLRNEAWCEEIDFDLDLIRRALEQLDD